MDNLKIYNKFRNPPKEALKEITGGRLTGMTDINPMWRIKVLTEEFGPCGVGWKYEVVKKWMEPGANGDFSAFCDINLYYKIDDKWSEAIPGTGGSMFVSKEKGNLRTNDECFKMALTDAISVAAKAIGVGADIYWEKDRTKYGSAEPKISEIQQAEILQEIHRTGWNVPAMLEYIGKKFPAAIPKTLGEINTIEFGFIMNAMKKKPDKAVNGNAGT